MLRSAPPVPPASSRLARCGAGARRVRGGDDDRRRPRTAAGTARRPPLPAPAAPGTVRSLVGRHAHAGGLRLVHAGRGASSTSSRQPDRDRGRGRPGRRRRRRWSARRCSTAGNPEGDVMFGVDNTLLSRARSTATCSSRTSRRGSPTCRRSWTVLRARAARPRRSTTATCELQRRHGLATPRASPRRPTLDDLADPRVQGPARRREPGRRLPGLAFLLATIGTLRRRLAGLLVGAAPTASRSSTTGTTPTTATSPAAADGDAADRRSATPAARRPRWCSPTRRCPAARRTTSVASARASARSSSPACCAAPSTEAAAQQLVDFLLGVDRSRRTCRSNLFVYPANNTVALPDVFTASIATADRRAAHDGARRRSPPTASCGSTDVDRRRSLR